MHREAHLWPPIPAKGEARGIDHAIAALARRQHGVVSRAQLLALGLSRHEIHARIAGGRLHPMHRGVFAVGHRGVSQRGTWLAAALAAGHGAVLALDAAAHLWEMRTTRERGIDVIVPVHRRGHSGIRVHQVALAPNEITRRHGIPVTTPARTLLDLAATLNQQQLERAIREAEYRGLASTTSLSICLSSHQGRRGARTLRMALESADLGSGPTRSELEHRFRALLRTHRLPKPQFNAPMRIDNRDIEVDCLWRSHRLIVELDGAAAHSTTDAFHEDRARDRALAAAGWTVIRITWRQLREEPRQIAEHLGQLLGGR